MRRPSRHTVFERRVVAADRLGCPQPTVQLTLVYKMYVTLRLTPENGLHFPSVFLNTRPYNGIP